MSNESGTAGAGAGEAAALYASEYHKLKRENADLRDELAAALQRESEERRREARQNAESEACEECGMDLIMCCPTCMVPWPVKIVYRDRPTDGHPMTGAAIGGILAQTNELRRMAQQNAEGRDRDSISPEKGAPAPSAPDRDALVRREPIGNRPFNEQLDAQIAEASAESFDNTFHKVAKPMTNDQWNTAFRKGYLAAMERDLTVYEALTAPAAGVVVPRDILARIDTNLRAGRITQSDLNEMAALLTVASAKEPK